jgi:hypothetical protein
MKKTNIILGIIIFISPWFLYKEKLRELRVEEQGKIVKMKIVKKPVSCLGTKVKWHMKVEYEGQTFDKQIAGDYCENHNIGDIVEIKYLENSNIILLPFESVWQDIYAGIALSLAGLIAIIYYGFIKKAPVSPHLRCWTCRE